MSLSLFMKLFMSFADKLAPLRKCTVRSYGAPWIDDELRNVMIQHDDAKKAADISGTLFDKQSYCKLRNLVTKLNKGNKKGFYQHKIDELKGDGKKLCRTLNAIIGRNSNMSASFVESEGIFIRKPHDITNYFNEYFTGKVEKLRNAMSPTDGSMSYTLIKDCIMKERQCMFEFHQVEREEVERMLLSLLDDKSPGTDNLDAKLLSVTANQISTPISHLFLNKCLMYGVCPEVWKESKVIPLPKDKKSTFTGPNSRPISLLPVLNK
ncbi:hypothetical protein J4Q44_G00084620 [Coregonus suidteri]|uniref:Reverse transcriptase n=1 Tax=Coregonus suidteri TaxID=861788 RepID=A0AAN8R206_9TELE